METAMRRIPVIAAVLVVVASAAFAESNGAAKKFLTEAIEGNFAEVQMGELAQTNAESADVKSYGQMLVKDHGTANQKAMAVAKSMNIPTPAGPSAKQKSDHQKMSKKHGAAFDREFAQHMVADHKKDVASYRKHAKSKDPSGQYAQETLPVLQQHLEQAMELEKKAGKNK
jgi:putative membrane protein